MDTQNLDIYFLRHGQTEWNVSKRVQGRLDSKLTEKGEHQAYLQSMVLSQRSDTSLRQVFCSPLGRTRQTADILLKNNDLKINFDNRLVEISVGEWEGALQSDLKKIIQNFLLLNPLFFLCMERHQMVRVMKALKRDV